MESKPEEAGRRLTIMRAKHFAVGESLERTPGEVAALAERVMRGEIVAQRTIAQPDGDIRHWGVDVTRYPVLERLREFGERHFLEVTGKRPGSSLVMVNYIEAQRSPNGSGGGWHRDSFRTQYKAIAYLTDVERASQGAFCYLPNSNRLVFRLGSLVHRTLTGGCRYSDRLIAWLLKLGVAKEVVLSKAGIPFFIDTSLIHRGLAISEGYRIAAFVYMFEGQLKEEFRNLLEKGV